MNDAGAAVEAFLGEMGTPYEQLAGQDVITFIFAGDHEQWPCFVDCATPHLLVVYSVAPFNIPYERRDQVMELVTRANHALRVGVLELDLDDGEVRFRTGVDLGGEDATPALVRQVVVNNLTGMNKHIVRIAAVVGGG